MSTADMPTTLVVARFRDPAGDVLEVVRDWTATGLLRPSLWLDADQPAGEAVLSVVDADGLRRHPAEQWLARSGITLDRVVLMQVVAEDRSADPLPATARALLDRVGLGNRPLVNLLVPESVGTVLSADALLGSRPNVLLQARDGQSPATVSQPVQPADLPLHAAAGLAVVGGLWTAMESAPFDSRPDWPGRQVVVVRAYARTLDSDEVLAALSDQVHRAEGTLPLPRSQRGDQLTEVPDVQALPTAEAAASSLVEAHSALTRFQPPPAYVPGRATGVKFLAAIGMFLSFLWGALRSSPRAWAEGLARRTAARIASGTTNLLYGSDSAYEVVVMGVRPGGRPAEEADDDVSALIDTAHRVAGEVSPGTEFTTVDAMALWSDMTTVGVSLADASDVPPQVRMPMLGVDRQVIDRPELIAPSPTAAPHGLPVGALPGVRALSVTPDDPYLAVQAHRLLTAERDRPGTGTDDAGRYSILETARTSLGAWVDRQRSYTWRVGYELALQLDQARETLAEAVRTESIDPAVPPRDVIDTQARTRRTLFGALAAALTTLAVVVGLVVGAVLSALIGGLIGLGVVLVWLVGSTVVFLRHQRKLFAWLHARDEAARRRAWAQQHAAHVAKEVHRLGVLYRQSRYWTRVLGTVVHDPFGVTGNAAEESAYPSTLNGSLPLSMAVGAATFSPDRHSELVHLARRAQLGIGWLGGQLESRIQAALEARSQRFGRAEHRLVWSDTAYSDQGPLPALVAGLGTEEDRRRAARDADARLVDWLSTLGAERGLDWSLAAVHPEVTISAGALPGVVSGQQFLSPVLGTAHYLDPQSFSATGNAAQSNVVDRTVLAAVGVPVPADSFVQLDVRRGTGRRSMDRFVARLDVSRQLMPDHVAHFAHDDRDPWSPDQEDGRPVPGRDQSAVEFPTGM